ncbi:MAG TPA: Gfo/Idh/MocA family oxidoreductase [Xanthobacteraceae bacterium]|nr:Gfo/Idh/MocA family oxidoreductase [Xanthobacteraceae bacterium]
MVARRLRLGFVGGGPGAFIGPVHRMAARLDDRYEIVAGAFSADPERGRTGARDLRIAADRAYDDYNKMAAGEAARPDGIDAVAIVTPNYLHHAVAKAFLAAGIHVICDKPMAVSPAQALDLAATVRDTGLVFGLTHNYTGYPMARQARAMVEAGELGSIRIVQVEYAQDWLATKLEATDQKQAAWRTDPARSGPAGCLADIGTHAYHLARFVTGLDCVEVAAELTGFVPDRRVDDNIQAMLRFTGGARGMVWASQVAPGHANDLRLRVYGEKAGLTWRQEEPDRLWFAPLGEAGRVLRRGGAGAGAAARQASRLPAGHPEGYIEAFAQLYADLAEQITAHRERRAPEPASLLVPGVEAGVDTARFVAAALESSRRNASWIALAAMR